jgi:hypothetical protein
VAELVDRAVALPPGPELAAALAGLPREQVPNARLVEVTQARSRQLAHDQAELFADLVEISHTVAVADLPGDTAGDKAGAVARAGERFEWAAHEIAAGLTWTPAAADRELGFATALCERLPLVFASLRQGRIDRGKARVSAPRGALSYPSRSEEELRGRFLGLMAYLESKGEGDNSMPGNQWPCPGVWGGALGGPRDMAKAGLPTPQSPEGATPRPTERHLKPTPVLRRHEDVVAVTSRMLERCPVRALKEMSGAPKSR